MPGLISLLGGAPKNILSIGEVSGRTDSGRFRVSLPGKIIDADSAAGASILPGSRVVVNESSAGYMIVAIADKFKTLVNKEVIIDG